MRQDQQVRAAGAVVALLLCTAGTPAKTRQVTTPAAPVQSIALAPAKPYAMRGVELGITLPQFRAIPVVADAGETRLRAYCSNEPMPSGVHFDDQRAADKDDGIVSCQWFGATPSGYFSSLFVDLGTGKGLPVFDFIDDGDSFRLFRIRSFANGEYTAGILDALTRNYGTPVVTKASFQTVGGATFTSTRSLWDNGASSIELVEPCRRLQRYCLEYRHTELGKLYATKVERRSAAAAGKI